MRESLKIIARAFEVSNEGEQGGAHGIIRRSAKR